MKIGRLNIGLERTNENRSFVIASWAYVTGYWRWAVWWTPPANLRCALRWPRIGPSFGSGTIYRAGPGSFGCWAVLPFAGSFSFATQPHMDAMKRCPVGARTGESNE